LITFHPETLAKESSKVLFSEIIKAISFFKDIYFIFTSPNADPESDIIIKIIIEFVKKNNNCCFIKSLGKQNYLSIIKYVDAVMGNSSSAITEVPSFKKATINIGDRQKGRMQAKSIINCNYNKKDLIHAINKIYNKKFTNNIKKIKNPYGKSGSSIKIYNIIKKNIIPKIIKKDFYDI